MNKILDKNLSICDYDENFRITNEISNKDFVYVYNSLKLGRPIDLRIYKGKVEIYYNYPITLSDLKISYELVRKVCLLYNINEFYKDNEIKNINDIDNIIKEELNVNKNVFDIMKTNNKRCISLVMNPYILKISDIEKFKKDNNLFENYLNELQRPGYYYASPIIYENGEVIYTITKNVLSIVPIKPIKEDALVAIPNIENNKLIDNFYIKYNDFINNINKDNIYDEEHIIVKIDKNKRNQLNKYKVEI